MRAAEYLMRHGDSNTGTNVGCQQEFIAPLNKYVEVCRRETKVGRVFAHWSSRLGFRRLSFRLRVVPLTAHVKLDVYRIDSPTTVT